MMNVTIYSKPGCHLCDVASDALRRIGADLPLSVATVDITTDPALFERYRYRIPVVVADEKVLGEGKVTEFGLRKALGLKG